MISLETGIDRRRRIGFRGISAKLHNVVAFLGVGLAGFLLAAVSVSTGATDISFWDALRILLGGSGSEDATYAIYEVRLPRILLAFMAGWSVALVGALLQSLAQNSLADPGLLGLTQGALTVIMIFIVVFPAVPRE